ncbi:MAG TPA: hypothetical protein VN829_24605, partial [Dongiaceae bacterium]|nr:hypothetical protein [Dongiaceae bacterium]
MAAVLLIATSLVHPGLVSAAQPPLDSSAASAPQAAKPEPRAGTIEIPGPLRSFLRMTGVSQEAASGEVLPLVARNAFLYGFQTGHRTEYLILANRYVQMARELAPFAGADGKIHVSSCDDALALIQVLGYQFEHGCSRQNASVITADAERAFITADSGFPLTKLEESLQTGAPFVYDYAAERVPVLFTENEWLSIANQKPVKDLSDALIKNENLATFSRKDMPAPSNQKSARDLLDLLLNNQNLDRLYSAMARLDPQTRQALHQSPGLSQLLPLAASFDFYGSRICIRDGAVVVPGGPAAERTWEELVGASPRSTGEFVTRLLTKGQGWLAAYFDTIARLSPEQQGRFAAGDRLKDLYDAYRSTAPTLSAATGVFPRNAALLLLLTRVQWDANGKPLVPGGPAVWQEILTREDKSGHLHAAAGYTHGVGDPDRLLDTLAAYSNVQTDAGPAQIYLMLSAIDGARSPDRQLPDSTLRLLAQRFVHLEQWYPVFSEFPALEDASITGFLGIVDRVDGISNPALRSNTLGAMQAEIGLWQILARQREIPGDALNASWLNTIQPYSAVASNQQLFEAARKSLRGILQAATGKPDLSQDQIVSLLAGPGPNDPDARRVHEELARKMQAVLDDQRLVSLDTLFALYDGLGGLAHGAGSADNLLPLAGALREFEMPRPIFTAGERASWSPLVYMSRHAELQVRTDLTKVIKGPSTPAQLELARARLAPFLRDTLVGLNYSYYEPPGAQVLHNNPLFVRSHDFSAASIQGVNEIWGAPTLIGIGATAGGGAYLIGSLADLPYALALTEEDFLAPQKVQALIWREIVPQLLVNSILPRWWNVSRDELHAATLYQSAGEELIVASAANADLRQKVIAILSDRMDWGRIGEIEQSLESPESAADLAHATLPTD